MFWQRPPDITAGDIAGIGHNGGPPLDDHVPEWGVGGIGTYFSWRTASEDAFKKYQLEILERGRYLQKEDVERIAEIIARRSQR